MQNRGYKKIIIGVLVLTIVFVANYHTGLASNKKKDDNLTTQDRKENKIQDLINQLLNSATFKTAEKKLLKSHKQTEPYLENYLKEYRAGTEEAKNKARQISALVGRNDQLTTSAAKIVSKRNNNIFIIENVLKKVRELNLPWKRATVVA